MLDDVSRSPVAGIRSWVESVFKFQWRLSMSAHLQICWINIQKTCSGQPRWIEKANAHPRPCCTLRWNSMPQFQVIISQQKNLQAGAAKIAKIVAPLQIMASSLHDASLSCDPQPRSSAGHPKTGTPHERGEYYIQTHHKLALQTTYGPIVPFLEPPKLDPFLT